MQINNSLIAYVLLALVAALAVSFLATPVVKTFAYKVGAIDVPKDNRRMHKVPIPRLGGLAIFSGFMVSVLLFVPITPELRSILLPDSGAPGADRRMERCLANFREAQAILDRELAGEDRAVQAQGGRLLSSAWA